MNDQERAELQQLKRRQSELLAQVDDLSRQLSTFESRFTHVGPSLAPAASPPRIKPAPFVQNIAREVVEEPTPAPEVPPVISPPPAPAFARTKIDSPLPAAASLPKELLRSREEVRSASFGKSAPSPTQGPMQASATASTSVPPPKNASFEMRLGTFWLVRIGVVMLLTGLVFFGNYAYQNYIGKLGPTGKVLLLYFASGSLLGIGAWLQRKQESLKNYSQVLLAGGLAAVYFTTYAAHHIPSLQVIKSTIMDGALLLGWAGMIIWIADRKKSEVMALFAVLLAYYSSVITHVGLFTLYSNLVLTLAAVFFLVRNRWAALSFASLAATYISYGFWRFYQDGHWQWASPEEGLWAGNYFLMGYWILFTAAVFLSRHQQFSGSRRASFVTLNNGAFFAAFILTMLQVHHGGFWKFSLIYGSVLLGLAALGRQFLADDHLSRDAYLTQGLLLVTLGFLAYYSGLRLSLILGAESVALVVLGRQWRSRVMEGGALVAASLSTYWGITTLQPYNHNGLIMGTAVGGLMLFNAFWHRKETDFGKSIFHRRMVFYTALALAMWAMTTWDNVRPDWHGVAFACESLAFLLICRLMGNRSLNLGALAFAIFGAGCEISTLTGQLDILQISQRTGLAAALIVGAIMLANALWEHRASRGTGSEETFSPAVACFSCLCLASWLATTWVFTPTIYLAPLLAVEALLFTVLYYPLRLRELSLLGQCFLFLTQLLWLQDAAINHQPRPWWNAAVIIAVSLVVAQWWQRQKSFVFKQPIGMHVQGIHALAVVGLLYFWLQPRFNAPDWLAFSSVLAVLLTAYAAFNRFWLLAAAGQIFLVISACQFFLQLGLGMPAWYLPLAPMAALCLLSFCAVQWFDRHRDARQDLHDTILRIGQVYRAVALIMSIWWVNKYIPARENCWVLAALGLLVFLLAGWRRNQELLVFSAAFTLTSIAKIWLATGETQAVYWPNFLVILLLLGQQQIARRSPVRFGLHSNIQTSGIVIGGLTLWLYLSRWILQQPDGFYLTAGWSALALGFFIAGMACRERVYRWLGLAVLACAMARVVFSDVWRLEPIYRILSFIALGIVLLVLGFIYNKYQEKIKEWL